MALEIRKDWQKLYQINYKKQDAKIFIYLAGEFGLKNLNSFSTVIKNLINEQNPHDVIIDFSSVSYLDSAAALALIQIQKITELKFINCTFVKLSEEARGIFSVIHENAFQQQSFKGKEEPESFFTQVGTTSLNLADDVAKLLTFSGELLSALLYTFVHPRSLRWKDVLFYMKRSGVDALPIVGLISVLIGLIIAFMSFLQLKQIGANIYVPSLVSFAMVKELGPIMTAILVAGRSGSAFAAEIGTMVVNEEVDALSTMGFNPVQFLTVPKVLAAVIVVPVLTLYAIFFGIIGGLIVGVTGLDLTINTYIVQSLKTIQVFDIVTSLIKAAVFAILITGIGCQRGFQVRSGAQDVGKFTTSAVVSAIFLIVVVDSIFAIMLYYIR
jgi:phospholipid/cholesterol/gamma-HCH transport system permease protein